jgi:hypothetical protein
MHLEVIVQRKRTEMLFEANPWRGSEGASSAGYHAPLGGFGRASLLRAQVATGSGESLGHFGIEMETTQTQGGVGKMVTHIRPARLAPGYTARGARGFQQLMQMQTGGRLLVETGDEFAADPVAWIGSGFDQADRNAPGPQTKPEGKPGEATADYFHGPEHGIGIRG